ncbi:hypothetical protein AWB65_01344 [Caballeronia humi]|jgi:hypothetical protein|uniref:Uncharacterized protein n=1 Tax=Caballeronia humi TaxID=326474 RepID=A0A158FX61_9BURK|nr:hypothetical protein AWB65_01344 [Caballeronia humi]
MERIPSPQRVLVSAVVHGVHDGDRIRRLFHSPLVFL